MKCVDLSNDIDADPFFHYPTVTASIRASVQIDEVVFLTYYMHNPKFSNIDEIWGVERGNRGYGEKQIETPA